MVSDWFLIRGDEIMSFQKLSRLIFSNLQVWAWTYKLPSKLQNDSMVSYHPLVFDVMFSLPDGY